MFETVVCGVDTSVAAGPVADVALWLAGGLGARLVLVHAVEEPVEEAESLLDAMRERLGPGRDDDVRLVDGCAAEAVFEAVGADRDGVIVLGSRGRGALRSAVLGSVSRTLARSARCPVVIVPPGSNAGTDASAESSIVCGVDGSDHAVAATRLAGRLANRLGFRLVLVDALPEVRAVASYLGGQSEAPPLSGQPDTRQRLDEEIVERAAGAANAEAVRVVEPGTPWQVLESVAESELGRLLVIAARGISDVKATLFGSVAAELASSAKRPVVVFPEPAE
jgi:nucleotide-binding universal stress UspA family protein